MVGRVLKDRWLSGAGQDADQNTHRCGLQASGAIFRNRGTFFVAHGA